MLDGGWTRPINCKKECAGAAGVRDVCGPESDMPCPHCVCFIITSKAKLNRGVHDLQKMAHRRPTDRPRASAGEEISTDFLLEKEKNAYNRR